MQTEERGESRVVTTGEATRELRRMVNSVEADPKQYALNSGRIGAATQLAKQGASGIQIQGAGRRKSAAFMIFVRAEGEGSDYVPHARMQGGQDKV